MKMYYSHDEAAYGTSQENDDLNTMGTLGINVLNPNSPVYQERVAILRECGRGDEVPAFLCSLIDQCDGVIFRNTVEGTKSTQTQAEIAKAQSDGKPILQLPTL